MKSEKQQYLDSYDQEHKTTMRVLRAYPVDQLDLRPAPTSKSARELAAVFAAERYLGTKLWHDEFKNGMPSGGSPPPQQADWDEFLNTFEKAHKSFRDLVAGASEETLTQPIQFFVGPKTMGPIPRIDLIWFLLSDEIHHRGQFTVYLRMAGGKVPSIYGPSADEPWT